ncbi:uncharacterized protein METZ01_LOCUS215965 [marine metagenome]|uniref:Uncharacterized protein n=1 Tax=marine metagenome TaxID=408172 RepID=A0A382FMB6_9ZZZZ
MDIFKTATLLLKGGRFCFNPIWVTK